MSITLAKSNQYRAASGLALALVLAFTGCTAPAPAAKFVEQAERFHSGAMAQTVVVDTDLNDYVREIGQRMVAAAKSAVPGKVNPEFAAQVRCHLVSSDTINAFPTGGVHVYVTTALLAQCQSEDELASAIAHAYAHLLNLDLEATRMRPDPNAPLTMVAWQFVANRFTLQQEQQADALALTIYSAGGWEPSRFANLFERLETVSGGNVMPDRQSLPARAASLRQQAGDTHRAPRSFPVADPRTFKSLRDRAARYREPESLPVPWIFVRAFPSCILSGDTRDQREAQERLRPLAPPPVQKLEPN